MIDVVRILLACVFAVAGLAKLADLEGSRRALAGFGLRRSLSRPLGLALPLGELAIAAGLVFTASARYAAVAAAGLLLVFCAALGAALAKGRRPDCHCFGQLHSAPAGWGTLVRNVGLALLAMWVAMTQAGHIRWPELVAALGGAALIAQAVLWYVLLRRYGHALRRIEELEGETEGRGLGVGVAAPDFDLPRVDGTRVGLRDLLTPGLPVMLAFVDSSCVPCRALLPDLARWQRELADQLTVTVVAHGDTDELRGMATDATVDLLVSAGSAVTDDYAVDGTPSAVLLASDGTIDSTLHYGAEEIDSLIAWVVEREHDAQREASALETRHAQLHGVEVALVR